MSFKPGDLVMVVKPTHCCGDRSEIGRTFVVAAMSEAERYCEFCDQADIAIDALDCGDSYFPLDRLIKIDPITEQDKTETLQEITA